LAAADSGIDAHELANRELIRPHTYRRGVRGPEPLTAAWLEEIELRRYSRHGAWLAQALEFGRHPGESVLIINPGLGTDALKYHQTGSEATVAYSSADHPELIQANLDRRAVQARLRGREGSRLAFADAGFDVVVWNALHAPPDEQAPLLEEIHRVLKAGGKVIGLFPAKFDAGYWQDVILPLQYVYWRRPPDPTTAPKFTARALRRMFARFDEHRVVKRHLRRSELPHLWRLMPLLVLERLIGRVLVMKAFKPLTIARSGAILPSGNSPLAA
jgi:SAM-dependent methyltransferase